MGTWLITGVAGFIGSQVAEELLRREHHVVGLDNLDPYYDPQLKRARLDRLRRQDFRFIPADITDESTVATHFADVEPTHVVHLAAQPGVRHALTDPKPYARTNLLGFVNVVEECRTQDVQHLVYASSSSIYGETSKVPFSEHEPADHPVSLYAATKRANELIAHSYSHVYGVPTTGLRFFTVYGPWGRPDMAYFEFSRAIATGEPIHIYGDGSALRDFTYIDDIVEAVIRVALRPAEPDHSWSAFRPNPSSSCSPFRILNVGRGQQISILEMIELLEARLGRSAERIFEDEAAGDVSQTFADVRDLSNYVDYTAKVPVEEGLARFVDWFKEHYGF
ncbi:MAG: NAD-dependent epimerase/dehydratase family protein [Actinobacteria bacterium]|nr:NAD-dependent epimerase/dehydratase family protein [Actinomycetota bacterium]